MGKKDIVINSFLSNDDRFSNLINVSLFKGKNIIKPEKLKNVDTVQSEILPSKDGKFIETLKRSRDVCKIYDDLMELVIIGIENQDSVHYAMPVRMMMNDSLSYTNQVTAKGREHSKNKSLKGTEYLSSYSRSDKLIPVMTLVVYYGSEKWDGAKSLYDMIDFGDLDSEFKEYITDYKINLLEINAIENLDEFSDELRAVFAFVKYQKDRQALQTYVNSNSEIFKSLNTEVAQTISTLVDTKELQTYIDKQNDKEGIDMCQALREIREEGIQIGMLAGEQKGIQEGKQEALISTAKNMLEMGAEIVFISRATGLTKAEIEKLRDDM